MIAGQYTKQPFELVPLYIDFVRELMRDDDTIASFTVTAQHADTGADTGAELLDGNPLLGDSLLLEDGLTIRANTRVVQRIQAGVDGDRHLLTYRVVTAQGHRWEGDIYLVVMEP